MNVLDNPIRDAINLFPMVL